MKSGTRILPNINNLYIIKQQQDAHKKKKSRISQQQSRISIRSNDRLTHRRSSDNSTVISEISKANSRVSSIGKLQKSFSLMNQPIPIPQVTHKDKKIPQWMSPYRKKVEREKIKENMRINKKILNPICNIRAKTLKDQYDKINKIKQRLCKFSLNPQSKSMSLKSQKSLDSYRKKSPIFQLKRSIQKHKTHKLISTINGDKNLQFSRRNRTQQSRSELVRRSYEIKKESVHRIWKQKKWLQNNNIIEQNEQKQLAKCSINSSMKKSTEKIQLTNLKKKMQIILQKSKIKTQKSQKQLPSLAQQINLK